MTRALFVPQDYTMENDRILTLVRIHNRMLFLVKFGIIAFNKTWVLERTTFDCSTPSDLYYSSLIQTYLPLKCV
jgi:hypothetical protein